MHQKQPPAKVAVARFDFPEGFCAETKFRLSRKTITQERVRTNCRIDLHLVKLALAAPFVVSAHSGNFLLVSPGGSAASRML